MTVRQPRYSKEEFARRGDEIYEAQVRQQVEDGNMAKLWRSTLKPETLRLMQVKSLLAIALKPVTQMLKPGLSALALAMFVDSADARRDLHDRWNRQRGF